MHPRNAGYQPGNYWAVCDRCGIDHRIDELRETWDGLLVCSGDWESRHPQEFLRGVADTIAPQGPSNPPPPDVFIQVTHIDVGQPGVPQGDFGPPVDPMPLPPTTPPVPDFVFNFLLVDGSDSDDILLADTIGEDAPLLVYV